jgi:hypothetical protein
MRKEKIRSAMVGTQQRVDNADLLVGRDLFRVIWSCQILDEMVANIIAQNPHLAAERKRYTPAKRDQVVAAVLVGGTRTSFLVLITHLKDCHMLVAAIVGRADIIVISYVRDFAASSCRPYAIDVQTLGTFLYRQFELASSQVYSVLESLVTRLEQSPLAFGDCVQGMSKVTPAFAHTIRLLLPEDQHGLAGTDDGIHHRAHEEEECRDDHYRDALAQLEATLSSPHRRQIKHTDCGRIAVQHASSYQYAAYCILPRAEIWRNIRKKRGAGDRIRTCTGLRPEDFKSPASAVPPRRPTAAQPIVPYGGTDHQN